MGSVMMPYEQALMSVTSFWDLSFAVAAQVPWRLPLICLLRPSPHIPDSVSSFLSSPSTYNCVRFVKQSWYAFRISHFAYCICICICILHSTFYLQLHLLVCNCV